jgi:hypothetical protein
MAKIESMRVRRKTVFTTSPVEQMSILFLGASALYALTIAPSPLESMNSTSSRSSTTRPLYPSVVDHIKSLNCTALAASIRVASIFKIKVLLIISGAISIVGSLSGDGLKMARRERLLFGIHEEK